MGLGELDGSHADATGSAMHQQRLTGLQAARSKTFAHTVKQVSGRLAASGIDHPSGNGRHCPRPAPRSTRHSHRPPPAQTASPSFRTQRPTKPLNHHPRFRPPPQDPAIHWRPGRRMGTPPARCSTSGRLMPAARTRSSTHPCPATGRSRSTVHRTSGAPGRVMAMAFMPGRRGLGSLGSRLCSGGGLGRLAGAASRGSRSIKAFMDSLTRPFRRSQAP